VSHTCLPLAPCLHSGYCSRCSLSVITLFLVLLDTSFCVSVGLPSLPAPLYCLQCCAIYVPHDPLYCNKILAISCTCKGQMNGGSWSFDFRDDKFTPSYETPIPPSPPQPQQPARSGSHRHGDTPAAPKKRVGPVDGRTAPPNRFGP